MRYSLRRLETAMFLWMKTTMNRRPCERNYLTGTNRYLREEMLIQRKHARRARAIGLDFPASVIFQITHTEPQAKGATVSSSFNQATLENGETVMVPSFINIGEKIRINTDSGEYMERADLIRRIKSEIPKCQNEYPAPTVNHGNS